MDQRVYFRLWCWIAVVCSRLLFSLSLECTPVYGPHGGCSFLPAPPGHTPSCARPGQTYCEQIPHYPKKLIKYLIDKWSYDFNTLIGGETRDDFNAYRLSSYSPQTTPLSTVYGPPNYFPPNVGYSEPIHIPKPAQHFVPSNNFGNSYLPPPPISNTNYSTFQGYPDRKGVYPPHVLNSNLQYQSSYFPQQNPSQFYAKPYNGARGSSNGQAEWWARYSRSIPPRYAKPPHQRYKRGTSKTKSKSKNIPKTESFKALVNKKPPRRVDQTPQDYNHETDVILSRQKRDEFLGIINDLTEMRTHSRTKRQTLTGDQLCTTRSEYIMPKAALNSMGNWMYVVNIQEIDQRYTQLVKSETCASQFCSSLCSLPTGYTARCEQKYVQKRLVALEGGGQRLYSDVFWFPSCCVCTISNN